MSINPITNRQQADLGAAQNRTNLPGATNFDQVLTSAAQGKEPSLSPAAVAEMLKLKMMSSAVQLGSLDAAPPSGSSFAGLSGALEAFLAQRANPGGSTVAVPAADPFSQAAPTLPAGIGPTTTEALIGKASARYGVDPALIKAVIRAESGFNPRAVSSAGAQGLMQLMPATARGLGVTDSFDPEQNVMAGTRFLKDMLSRYGGNVDSALAAYNWGPGNVDRHGDTLPRETREYLVKVKGYYAQYQG